MAQTVRSVTKPDEFVSLLAVQSLLTLLTSSAAFLGSTTGNISVEVVDEKGGGLPGVLATARDAENGLERAVPRSIHFIASGEPRPRS